MIEHVAAAAAAVPMLHFTLSSFADDSATMP